MGKFQDSAAPRPPHVQISSDYIKAKEYLEAIITSTSDAICTTDLDGRFVYFSPGAERMFGVNAERMVGRYARDFYAGGFEEAQRIMRLLRRCGSVHNHETAFKTPDGRLIYASMSLSLLKDRSGRLIGTLGISKDISSRVDMEKRLKALSLTDSLTGLYNQRFFRERLSQEVGRARRQRHPLSLVLIDLDDFKEINDARGHLAGDRLLKSFAAIILQSIRKDVDTAFRYGGDEFVLILPGLSEKRARLVAQRVETYARKNARGAIAFSCGVASLRAGLSAKDILDRADRRMYRAKAAKKKAPAA